MRIADREARRAAEGDDYEEPPARPDLCAINDDGKEHGFAVVKKVDRLHDFLGIATGIWRVEKSMDKGPRYTLFASTKPVGDGAGAAASEAHHDDTAELNVGLSGCSSLDDTAPSPSSESTISSDGNSSQDDYQ